MGIWRFAGAFAVVERQSELKISEANAGAKPPECIACPDNNRDQPACAHSVCYALVLFFCQVCKCLILSGFFVHLIF